MSRRPYIIILIVLLVAVAAVLGFMYFRERPQVSKEDTQAMLEGYKAGLEDAYAVLNNTYGQLSTEKNTGVWQKFSSEWIPGLSEIRPADINKKLPSEYEAKKNLLVSTHGALVSLWTEYNKDFTGDATNQELVKEMKTGIEDVFENLEI